VVLNLSVGTKSVGLKTEKRGGHRTESRKLYALCHHSTLFLALDDKIKLKTLRFSK
jgi:hypothetical protein